jgi:hypothetical protein
MATADSVTLDWQPPKEDGGSPVSSYKIMLSKDGSDWSEVATPAKLDKKYTAKNLEEGTKYMFRVIAVNDIGESKPLESECFTPQTQAGKMDEQLITIFDLLYFFNLIRFEHETSPPSPQFFFLYCLFIKSTVKLV